MINRRSLITGLISFAVTAPAIVRAVSIMPIKVILPAPKFPMNDAYAVKMWARVLDHEAAKFRDIYDALSAPADVDLFEGYIGEYEGMRFA